MNFIHVKWQLINSAELSYKASENVIVSCFITTALVSISDYVTGLHPKSPILMKSS